MNKETLGRIEGNRDAILYEDPSINSEEFMFLTPGTEVLVIDPNSADDFYHVFTPIGLEGWILKDYVEIVLEGGN